MKLPENWKKLRIGELGVIQAGGTPSKKNISFWKGSIPWVSSSDISEDNIHNISVRNYITETAVLKSSTKIIRKNSLLVVSRVGVGKIVITPFDICTSQDFQNLTIKSEKIFNIYIAYFLKFKINELITFNQGTSIKGFVKSDFENFEILIPPIEEQKAIADLLSSWDEAIEKTEKLIKLKEKKFKWLLNELISEKAVKRNPEAWKKVKLGSLFNEEIKVEKGRALTKKTKINGHIPVVAGGQSYAYYTNVPTHNFPTVTVSSSGAYAGFIWYHNYPIWASDCNVFYLKKGNTKFLYYVLKRIQHKIYKLQSGGAQPHIYSKDMRNLVVFWTTEKEKLRIIDILTSAQREIELLTQITEKYKLQKKGLMQKLLTGTWRIKSEIIDKYKK
ncbi:MAG: restriction endonuclease subunit S [Candidatus Muirbacterium halophilum]|nr:restriction endonuclease subunit S [Candidatus Muirbacterium halophilum]MCK9474809.1 restriction endonuclease subunit S [Candidatus Muirbacterium halophilum]